MAVRDGIYLSKGIKEVKSQSKDSSNPAKFYLVSGPAHKENPITKINIATANPTKLGNDSTSNKRTIYKFIDPSVCESCQLVMGMTILEPNNMWNTMPCHTNIPRYIYTSI